MSHRWQSLRLVSGGLKFIKGEGMVSIYHTPNGWTFSLLKERGYYSSLAEVMDAAYAAENREADHDRIPQIRNSACYYCRLAKGC